MTGARTVEDGDAEFYLLDVALSKPNAFTQAQFWQIAMMVRRPSNKHGYKYIDVFAPDGVTRLRLTAKEDSAYRDSPAPGVRFTTTEATQPAPKYGVTYENNVDPELRKHWIAGTTVKVVEVQTGSIIGEQSYWRWDTGFGNQAGGRQPWNAARESCPRLPPDETMDGMSARFFVEKILKPKQGN